MPSFPAEEKYVSDFTSEDKEIVYSPVTLAFAYDIQVILFEVDCAISYTDLHELFCQFISCTNGVNSGKFMDNCWISCQVMADMKKL